MPTPRIDLYSDTKSKPTSGMRKAIAEAEVGDEQRDEDPTVLKLQDMTCELLGTEAALFLPSGTMCNAIAYRVWTEPGQEVIVDKTCHVLHSEAGGPAALSGVMTRILDGDKGIFSADMVRAAIRPTDRHNVPQSALISLEQTANAGGGSIWPLTTIEDIGAVAKEHDIILHMDGARLLNAVVASNVSAAQFAAPCDSLWIDLSKGLGCPVGAVLAGSVDFIHRARRFKHQFGGAMRQAGVIAAAGVYALEHNIERMAEDHANAKKLAKGIDEMDGLSLEFGEPDTNMIYFSVEKERMTAQQLHERLLTEHGVRVGVSGPQRFRAVTHLDVSETDIDDALNGLNAVLAA